MKKVLVVAATQFEIQHFIQFLQQQMSIRKNPLFSAYEIDVLVTGVGIFNTAFKISQTLTEKTYDFVLNAGIAGSFNAKILRGSVVEVAIEQYGDLGVEEADGSFTDIFELGLCAGNEAPFKEGKLWNPTPLGLPKLPMVAGLTVHKVHGHKKSIDQIKKKYEADVETMEGAAFFQACLSSGVAFAQIRSISNMVEPRNRENWLMDEAIEQLNTVLAALFINRMI